MYSWRWSSRTFSMGLLGLATMPSRLPPYASMTKAGSLPSSGLLDRRHRYYGPLGLPPSTVPFHLRLIGTAFARRGCRDGSLLFRIRLCLRALLHTPEASCILPELTDAVCCLRRDMSGSANLSLSGAYVSGLQGSLHVGPANSLPSQPVLRPTEGFRRTTQMPRSPSSPGACYAALRRLPRRDSHPQVWCSENHSDCSA
jgi:hypothetical protein